MLSTIKDDADESPNENLKPWSQRWNDGRIGFHLKDVNPIIIKYSSELFKSSTTTILKSTNTCSEEADDAANANASASASASASVNADAYSTNNSNDNDDDDDKKQGQKQQRRQLPQRIFVPLCGKTIDMAYLASLSSSNDNDNNSSLLEVVGMEGIRVAIEEFIEEHPGLNINTKPIITNTSPMLLNGDDDNKNNNSNNSDDDGNSDENSTGKFEQFVGDNITLLKGDYFDLLELESELLSTLSSSSSSMIGSNNKFDYIYDRGSMVAIEPQLRTSYVKILKLLLKPGGKILLVALERKSMKSEEATKKGPPYSISEQIVRELFSFNDDDDDDKDTTNWIESITLLEENDQLVKVPEDKQRYPDLDQLLETVYVIQRKN